MKCRRQLLSAVTKSIDKMLYVKLDASGNIVACNTKKTEECNQEINIDYLNQIQSLMLSKKDLTLSRSMQSDLSMVRVLEDVIDTLVKKSIINITDLPPEVQDKLTTRKKMREEGSLKNDSQGLIKI
jgi:hypothetical protein